MYESIGPFKDFMQQMVGIVRVSGAQKQLDPCSIDLTYAKKLPVMKNGAFAESNDVYVLRNVVKEDVKKVEAMSIAKKAADELIAKVPQGWDGALGAINKEYGASDGNDMFTIQPMQGLKRISEQEVRMMRLRSLHDPVQSMYVNRYAHQKDFIDRLYSMLEPEKTAATDMPKLMEFKPNMSYYVIKSMSRNAVDANSLEEKGRLALMHDYVNGQSLGFEYFMADNIIRRTGFEWDEELRGRPVQQELPPAEEVI